MVEATGWSLERVTALTRRQFNFMVERYWDKKMTDFLIQLKTNPFRSSGGGKENVINASEASSAAELRALGMPGAIYG